MVVNWLVTVTVNVLSNDICDVLNILRLLWDYLKWPKFARVPNTKLSPLWTAFAQTKTMVEWKNFTKCQITNVKFFGHKALQKMTFTYVFRFKFINTLSSTYLGNQRTYIINSKWKVAQCANFLRNFKI